MRQLNLNNPATLPELPTRKKGLNLLGYRWTDIHQSVSELMQPRVNKRVSIKQEALIFQHAISNLEREIKQKASEIQDYPVRIRPYTSLVD